MLIFIYFIIYSFLGYICEVIFCSVGQRRLVNRGILYLPICPIYGVGAIIVLLVYRYVNNYLLIFIISFIFSSLIEYMTSYIFEKIFNLRLWDYSERKYNINGRVCLKNSFLFGIMGVVMTWVHPYIYDFVNRIDIINILGIIIIISLVIDFIFSIYKYLNISKLFDKLYKYLDEKIDILNDVNAMTFDFFYDSKFAKKMRKFIYCYPSSKKNKSNLKEIYYKYYKK